ncbi:MAG: hypothetical protein V4850_14105 [Myxococcota bacterium]
MFILLLALACHDASLGDVEVPAEAWLDAMVHEDARVVDAQLLFTPEQTVTFTDAGQPEPIGREVILARTAR